LADPTTSAYNRVNARGFVRPQVAPTVVVPNLEISPSVEYGNKFPTWSMIRDCYDGEAVVKAAGETYLPKLSAHSPAEYEVYKNRSYFYNAVRRTHRGLMGSLFRKPVEVTLPENLKSRINLNRITQDAHSFSDFTRTLGHEVLLTGRFGVLADFKGDKWQSPYLAGYLAENIYSWRQATYEDREVVDRVILLESESTPTEYGSEDKLLIRVLRLDPDPDRPGKMRYWQTEIRPDATGDVQMIRNVDVKVRAGRRLDYIPFVFTNATDLRPNVGPAPLEDVATINISHYQSTAHLEHGRFYAGMPTYVTAGAGGNSMPGLPEGLANPAPLSVGPSFVWELEEGAKAWLLEFNGHGLTFLENAVDSKQLQMQSLGGRLISSTRRAAAMSDEAWHLLETGDEATLMDVAVTADEACSKALTYLADIMGEVADLEKSGIVVEFNKEFVRSELTARELRALQSLAERAHIPRDVMYYALREVGVVPVEYTLEDFNKMMDTQSQIWKPPVDPNAPTPTTAPGGRPGVRPQPPRNVNNGGSDGQGG
jgi:hypothetical protein